MELKFGSFSCSAVYWQPKKNWMENFPAHTSDPSLAYSLLSHQQLRRHNDAIKDFIYHIYYAPMDTIFCSKRCIRGSKET